MSGEMELVLPATAEAPAAARRALEPLRGTTHPALLADLALVVSELVSNSVRHGPGGPITLRLVAASPSHVRGEVEDDGDGTVAIRSAAAGAKPGGGGHGLRILDVVASRWGVHEGSTHVWFELCY
jgi:anti-sigma regulatory factor (Ser/Thr protein kinase)